MQAKPIELEPTLKAFHNAGARVVLIGGMAMVLRGSAHVTYDVDFAFATDPQNLTALVQALEPYDPRLRNFPPDLPFAWDERTLRSHTNVTLETTLGDVDLLGYTEGVPSFGALYEAAEEFPYGETTVLVASIEHLIAMKRAANRDKDQRHIMELQAMLKIVGEQKR